MLVLSYQAIPGGSAGPVIPLEDFSAQVQLLPTQGAAGSAQQAGMGELALPPAFLPSSSQLPPANRDVPQGKEIQQRTAGKIAAEFQCQSWWRLSPFSADYLWEKDFQPDKPGVVVRNIPSFQPEYPSLFYFLDFLMKLTKHALLEFWESTNKCCC